MTKSVVTELSRAGQQYVDTPVYTLLEPKKIVEAIALAWGYAPPKTIRIVSGYRRLRLQWRKPGESGATS